MPPDAPSRTKLLGVETARGVAACLVVFYHAARHVALGLGEKPFGSLTQFGHAGVDFFFVLSGFIIVSAHRHDIGRPERLPGYLARRLLRVYPTYWAVCALVCAAALALPPLRAALPSDPAVFAKALLLWPQDPAEVGALGSPILFVAWSLQYEMLFYGVFALFVVGPAWGLAALAALGAVALGCAAAPQCGYPARFVSSVNLVSFGLGAAGALLAAHPSAQLRAPLRWAALGIGGFLALGAAEAAWGRDLLPLDRKLAYALLSAVAIVGLAQAERRRLVALRSRSVALLGAASYALYLLHMPVLSALCKAALALGIAGDAALAASFVAIFAATLLCAVAFHRAVERPLLRWLRARVAAPGTRRLPPLAGSVAREP